MNIRYILSPFSLDQPIPELLTLADSDWLINQPPISGGDMLQQMAEIYCPLRDIVADTLEKGQRPVCISCDCCATIGVMAGLQQANRRPMVLWLDAHGDFNTPDTSPSGFVGGMPLAMLVGRGDQTLMQAVGVTPLLESQIMLSDARDLDPAESDTLRASDVLHVPRTSDIIDNPFLQGPMYVHFDVDVVRLEDVPAVGYPAEGGISASDLQEVFRYLSRSGDIIAVTVGSWDPRKDSDGKSQQVCMELLDTLLYR
jgi:arginase